MSLPTVITNKLITVLEAIFADLSENLESSARDCNNNDASTALGNAASAVNAMDIPYIVREALEMPHGGEDTPLIPAMWAPGKT